MNSYAPPKPDYSAIKAFLAAVHRPIAARFEGRLISRSYLRGLQVLADHEWSAFVDREPGPYLLAEGCSVTGLEVGLHAGELMLRWRTAFLSGPRWPQPSGVLITLGIFQGYDLYAAYRAPAHATVYAVHVGGNAEWHLHFHRRISGMTDMAHGAAIQHALRRAQLVNAFWGSQYAKPPPLGRAALPVRRRG